MKRTSRTVLRAVLVSAVLAASPACATTSDRRTATRPASGAVQANSTPAAELRLGYFANLTHATPVYGVGAGVLQQTLGSTRLATQVFNAGPAAVEALFAGSLDAAFVGPNPAINAFVKSQGEAIRIVAGATSGGAALIVAPGIDSAADLRGRKIASPQTGGTQDIALRTYLAENGLRTDLRGAGDTTIVAQENAQTLTLFQAGEIDGAWAPEPWASRLVLEGGGKVLVDEKDRWPGGAFVTTHLVVRTDYLQRYPQTVKALLQGAVEANRLIAQDPAAAKTVLNQELAELTGKALTPDTLDRAFAAITVTEDPVASSLKKSAQDAFATGLVEEADLSGIYDLTLLREVLGRAVHDAGLGSSG